MSKSGKDSLYHLIAEALYICKKYDQVSPALFQRIMSIDFDIAEALFFKLKSIKLVTNVRAQEDDDENNPIADVNRVKLKELSTN